MARGSLVSVESVMRNRRTTHWGMVKQKNGRKREWASTPMGTGFRTSLVAVAILLLVAPSPVRAQARATIQAVTGVIVDGTGAVLANARVELTSDDGRVQEATTDGAGTFRFEAVRPGRY